eukprot:Polyplicarium_translucidae@DN3233_c0_g3_i4.p3
MNAQLETTIAQQMEQLGAEHRRFSAQELASKGADPLDAAELEMEDILTQLSRLPDSSPFVDWMLSPDREPNNAELDGSPSQRAVVIREHLELEGDPKRGG